MGSLFGNKKQGNGIRNEEDGFDFFADKDYSENAEYADDEYYDEGEYAEEGSDEYYEDGEYAEGSGEYYEEGEYAEGTGEYYEEGEYAEGSGEYSEDTQYADGSDEYYEEGEYVEGTDEYYEDEQYDGEIEYDEQKYYNADEFDEDEEDDRDEGGFFSKISFIDVLIGGVGIAVVALAIFVMMLFFNTKAANEKDSILAEVGNSLKQIELIGGKGIEAVANATIAKIELQNQEQEKESDDNTGSDYIENEYTTTYAVSMSLTSVQKDLKIKFSNRETGKLIANVPFKAIITLPDGSTQNWSDDDMDGVIYAKNLDAGAYKVRLESLEDKKYSNYILPSAAKSVEVKKKIEYQKVEVKDEIKKESEINVSVEDTKKNETVVESTLADTVEWVASTSTANTYVEVLKNTIPDPEKVQLEKPLQNVAATSSFDKSSLVLLEGQTATLTVSCSDDEGTFTLKEITFTSMDENVVKILSTDGNKVTIQAVAAGNPTLVSYTAKGTVKSNAAPENPPAEETNPTDATTPAEETNPTEETTPATGENPGGEANTESTEAERSARSTETEVVLQGSCMVTVKKKAALTLSKTSCELGLSQAEKVQITVPEDYDANLGLVYTVEPASATVATATVDETGKVTITGVGVGETNVTVSVNYKDGAEDTKLTAVIAVKVADARVMKLDKAQAIAFVTDPATPIVIKAEIENLVVEDVPVTAVSSDESIAIVAVENKEIKITGLKAGSAIITVKYKEPTDETELTATCAVTVMVHPKNDKETKLLDEEKNPIFVLENETYREAVYADYYTAEKFFIMKGVKYTGWQTIDNHVYYYNSKGEAVTGEQVIQGAKYNFASDGSLITGSGVLGIDVSKWNGNIDWKAVKNSGVSYVIIRCGYRGSSQGMLIEDSKFTKNIQGAIDADLKVGVYFFSQAIDEVEAVYEASYVLEKIKGYRISYPVFLDVESSGGRGDKIDKATRTAVCKAFCKTIENAGYTAGVYANRNWLEEMLDPSALSEYKIWLAQYAKEPTYKGRYDMWQYKSTGSITGISGNVDMNMSYLGY